MTEDASNPATSSSSVPVSGGSKGVSSGTSAFAAAPPGHGLRRSFTVDESRKRPSLGPSSAADMNFDAPRRRSSNFTDYSYEARDILNPKAGDGNLDHSSHESSSLASISLAFALLPALAGALFKNGSAMVTDLMLLGVSGIFLHWSVTQPWTWYYSAQGVRIKQQSEAEMAIEDDSDLDDPASASPLDDVPEEEEDSQESTPKKAPRDSGGLPEQQRTALRELYIYELFALLACFSLPLLAAFLLHAIRAQLSRPSEGLVSNYNLTIFCLVSELRVFSHMFKLVQSRTLHLQRIVNRNPYGSTSNTRNSPQMSKLLERLENLEARSGDGSGTSDQKKSDTDTTADKWKQEANLLREVRNGIQPELDALNRAVRRYEKKATLLQMQTEARFAAVDARVEDAIALAAAAAKNSASHKTALSWVMDRATASALLYSKNRGEPQVRVPRSRGGRSSSQGRYGGDRVPGRVAKR